MTRQTTFPSTAMSSDSNPPRTLKSLWHYAHCQEGLIRPLLKPEDLYFRQAPFPAWVQLHSSAWGKNPDSLDTTEPVIRGPDTIDNTSILPDVVPSHCKVMLKPNPLGKCWRFGAERFLIRSEYEEAEEYLLSGFDQEAPGVVITGQPGIGLSPLSAQPRQDLTVLRQGKLFFYFALSCGASPINSLLSCNLNHPTRYSSTKVV